MSKNACQPTIHSGLWFTISEALQTRTQHLLIKKKKKTNINIYLLLSPYNEKKS